MLALELLLSRPLVVLETDEQFDRLMRDAPPLAPGPHHVRVTRCARHVRCITTCCLVASRPMRGLVMTRDEARALYERVYTWTEPLPRAFALARSAAMGVAPAHPLGALLPARAFDAAADVHRRRILRTRTDAEWYFADDDDDTPPPPEVSADSLACNVGDVVQATRALLATYLYCAYETQGDVVQATTRLYERAWSMPTCPFATWMYEPRFAEVRAGFLLQVMLSRGAAAAARLDDWLCACIRHEDGSPDLPHGQAMRAAAELASALMPDLFTSVSHAHPRDTALLTVPCSCSSSSACVLRFEPNVTPADLHAAMRVVPGAYRVVQRQCGAYALELSSAGQRTLLTRTLPQVAANVHTAARLCSLLTLCTEEVHALLWACATALGFGVCPLHEYVYDDPHAALQRVRRIARSQLTGPALVAALSVAFTPRVSACWLLGSTAAADDDYLSDDGHDDDSYTTDRQELLDREVRRRAAEERRNERRADARVREESAHERYGGPVTPVPGSPTVHLARLDALLKTAAAAHEVARLRFRVGTHIRPVTVPHAVCIERVRELVCSELAAPPPHVPSTAALYAPQFTSGSMASVHDLEPGTLVRELRAFHLRRCASNWWRDYEHAVPRMFCDAVPGIVEHVLYGGAPWKTL